MVNCFICQPRLCLAGEPATEWMFCASECEIGGKKREAVSGAGGRDTQPWRELMRRASVI